MKKTKTERKPDNWSRPISLRADADLEARLMAIASHPKHRRKLGSLIRLMVEDQLPLYEAELGIKPAK